MFVSTLNSFASIGWIHDILKQYTNRTRHRYTRIVTVWNRLIWNGTPKRVSSKTKQCFSDFCMMTSSNETFSALLALCEGNPPVTGGFPSPRPVTRSFDVFFDLRLNKQLSKQSSRWWFETQSRPLWCHSNGEYSLPDTLNGHCTTTISLTFEIF